MNILVAILAMLMGHRPVEIAVLVALGTGCLGVLAEQWELRIVVIEAGAWSIRDPTARVVASLAATLHFGVLESAAVRIAMAILATG